MKKSEIIAIITNELKTMGLIFNESNYCAEEILKVIEEAGMLPPPKPTKNWNSYDCDASDYYTYEWDEE